MNIGTYSASRKEILYWLITAATFVAMIGLGVWINNKVSEGTYEKQRLYQTAIKTTDKGEFNYSIDSRQGNVLTYGTFTFLDLYKFPEMNKEFAYVQKTKEEYNRHEREVCETYYRTETETRTEYDTDGEPYEVEYEVEVPYEECHTEEYYEWDYQGSEQQESKRVKFMEREYNTSTFHFGFTRSIDASEIIQGANDRYWYPEGKKESNFFGFGGHSVGDIRYHYDIRDTQVSGSIFVNTYNGTLEPAESGGLNVSSSSIEQRVTDASTQATVAAWTFGIFWTLLTIGATIGVTYLWWQAVYGI